MINTIPKQDLIPDYFIHGIDNMLEFVSYPSSVLWNTSMTRVMAEIGIEQYTL